MKNYEQHIRQGGFERLKNCVENLVLRPNDSKVWLTDNYNEFVKAVEAVLNSDYQNTNIYKYYYELPKVKHGFCCLERWERGLLF